MAADARKDERHACCREARAGVPSSPAPVHREKRFLDLREILRPGRELEIKNPETGVPVRWTVQGLLQEGGRGFAFEVSDPQGRPAVLKGPSRAPGAAYAAIIEREILKKVSPHPNLVKYLGAKDESGLPLVVLGWTHENPYMRLNGPAGERLARWRGASGIALPATTAVELVFEVLLGLEHLHSKGFVHTDVKPANVMMEVEPLSRELTDDAFFRAIAEGRGRAVLVDVGGARSESFLEDLNAGNVDASIVPPELTPLYAPPEAIVGAETREGRRPIYSAGIDVYQVGILLGIFLTGLRPYEHLGDRYDTANQSHVLEIKMAERRGELLPFAPGAIRAARHDDVGPDAGGKPWRPAFDDAAESILAKCLGRDAKERGTIAQLREAFERAFELTPNPQARTGAVAPAFKLKTRSLRPDNRLLAAAAAGAEGAPATPVPLPPNAAQQVLRMAAQLASRSASEAAAAAPAPPAASAPTAPAPPAEPRKTAAVVRSSTRSVPRPGAPAAPPAPAPTTTPSPPAQRPLAPTAEVALDRVILRVAPKDTGKTFEVISKEGARSLEVESNKFEFRIAPARACEVVRRLIEVGVDVFYFERRKPATTGPVRAPAPTAATPAPPSAPPPLKL